MSHGLPIIASNVGGIKEAVRNSENGFLIHHNLPQLLSILIENPMLRKKWEQRVVKYMKLALPLNGCMIKP